MKRRSIFQSILAIFLGRKVVKAAPVSPWPPILKTLQFFPEVDPKRWTRFMAEIENAAIARGLEAKVFPNDDHSEHIRVHSKFALENGVNNYAMHEHLHLHLMMESPRPS